MTKRNACDEECQVFRQYADSHRFGVGFLLYVFSLCSLLIDRLLKGEWYLLIAFPVFLLVGYFLRDPILSITERICITPRSIAKRILMFKKEIRWEEITSCETETIRGAMWTFAYGGDPFGICRVRGRGGKRITFNDFIKDYEKLVEEIRRHTPPNVWN